MSHQISQLHTHGTLWTHGSSAETVHYWTIAWGHAIKNLAWTLCDGSETCRGIVLMLGDYQSSCLTANFCLSPFSLLQWGAIYVLCHPYPCLNWVKKVSLEQGPHHVVFDYTVDPLRWPFWKANPPLMWLPNLAICLTWQCKYPPEETPPLLCGRKVLALRVVT